MRHASAAAIAALVGALSAAPAAAQTYEISWWTVDGGGATFSTGGTYSVGGTIGQPDAGGPHTGGSYAVRGGFWGGSLIEADLAISKTDGVTSVVAGTPVSYTITVGNAGPNNATGVQISDALPANLTSASWTCLASSGSLCGAGGAGGISDTASLLVGGTLTYTLSATVDPATRSSVVNVASAAGSANSPDAITANNSATDTDAVTASANVDMDKVGSPDPVKARAALSYTLTVTNIGPSTATGVSVSDPLPAGVTFVSASAGCVNASGTVTCALPDIAPASTASATIVVQPQVSGTLTNTATALRTEPDPVSANDSATDTTTVRPRSDGELVHGLRTTRDLASLAGPLAAEDWYRIHQKPYASYEVVVDAASGDVGAGSGPFVQRIAPDGISELQAAQAIGVGPARSLRWQNATGSAVDGEFVRVTSGACGTGCGADDVFRLRAYETTYSIPRFNNAGSQITVLVLQNPTGYPVSGNVYFWSPSGSLLATQPFTLAIKAAFVINTGTISGASGVSGTISVSHDARYGDLVGKTVALEPSTGFSFDSPMVHIAK